MKRREGGRSRVWKRIFKGKRNGKVLWKGGDTARRVVGRLIEKASNDVWEGKEYFEKEKGVIGGEPN